MTALRHIPNALTTARLALVVPLVVALRGEETAVALLLLATAGATDVLDGFLAREFAWKTKLGSWMDPIVDKLFIAATTITLLWVGALPGAYVGLVVARDLYLLTGAVVLLSRGVRIRIEPNLLGRFATLSQNSVLVAALLGKLWSPFGHVLTVTLAVASVLTLASAVSYGRAFVQKYSSGKATL